MKNKALTLLLLTLPIAQRSIANINHENFPYGTVGLSLSALLIFLNILDTHNQENLEKQKMLEQEKIKTDLIALGVKFRNYYGYQRSGNRVNTDVIVHETYQERPETISEEQRTQMDLCYEKWAHLNESTMHNKSFLKTFNKWTLAVIALSFLMWANSNSATTFPKTA